MGKQHGAPHTIIKRTHPFTGYSHCAARYSDLVVSDTIPVVDTGPTLVVKNSLWATRKQFVLCDDTETQWSPHWHGGPHGGFYSIVCKSYAYVIGLVKNILTYLLTYLRKPQKKNTWHETMEKLSNRERGSRTCWYLTEIIKKIIVWLVISRAFVVFTTSSWNCFIN